VESQSQINVIKKRNVLGKALIECSCDPMTGWFRNGSCETDPRDLGKHVICAEMTTEFLLFSKSEGNDLSSPVPNTGFPGLQPGDHWCVCAERWKDAMDAGVAPPVLLSATEFSALSVVSLEDLKKHSKLN